MLSVYIPCRFGSERVKNKNTKLFSMDKSLLEWKLKSLLTCSVITEIVVSTNDPTVMSQARAFGSRVKVVRRAEELCQTNTKTDDLVLDMLDTTSGEYIMWTHVTSPFLKIDTIQQCYELLKSTSDNDSVMTVTNHQTFMWDGDGPINYDRLKTKWPNTQTLRPIYEINSGLFMIKRAVALRCGDRIGDAPFLWETRFPENLDVDWEHDFQIAQQIAKLQRYDK